jgi:hypothetical protein
MRIKPNHARGPDKWVKQVRFDIEFAKRMVLEQGSCSTILVVHCREPATKIILQPSGDLTKDTVAAYLRALCTAEDAEGFSFISEAWMRVVTRRDRETQAEHDERAYGVTPSQAEDRLEVIIAEIVYRADDGGRRTLHEHREIVRDAAGKATGFRPVPRLPGSVTSSEGRWVEVLPPERPTEEERAYARETLATVAGFGLSLETRGPVQ